MSEKREFDQLYFFLMCVCLTALDCLSESRVTSTEITDADHQCQCTQRLISISLCLKQRQLRLCRLSRVHLLFICLLSLHMHVRAVSVFLFFSVYTPLTSYLIDISYVLNMVGFFFFCIFCSLCMFIISRIALVPHGRGLDVKRPWV